MGGPGRRALWDELGSLWVISQSGVWEVPGWGQCGGTLSGRPPMVLLSSPKTAEG